MEVLLLVAVVLKLGWDCVRYRRTGHLPWVARHMCWSLPGTGRVLTRSAPIGHSTAGRSAHLSLVQVALGAGVAAAAAEAAVLVPGGGGGGGGPRAADLLGLGLG